MTSRLKAVLMTLCAALWACSPADDASGEDAVSATPAIQATPTATAAPAEISELGKVPSGPYTIDKKHAYISFSYSHKGFSNPHVGFRDFDVALELDANAPENSTLEITIDPNSIDSRVPEFDDHLKGDKLFDTANHSLIMFASTSIRMTGVNSAEVSGDLTMKGVTKAVTFDTKINKTAINPRNDLATIGISASTTVKRSEWNLGYAVPVVGDEVTINIELEMPQVPPAD